MKGVVLGYEGGHARKRKRSMRTNEVMLGNEGGAARK